MVLLSQRLRGWKPVRCWSPRGKKTEDRRVPDVGPAAARDTEATGSVGQSDMTNHSAAATPGGLGTWAGCGRAMRAWSAFRAGLGLWGSLRLVGGGRWVAHSRQLQLQAHRLTGSHSDCQLAQQWLLAAGWPGFNAGRGRPLQHAAR